MQINTIQRNENVEPKGAGGKRGARDGSASAESAFAAVFAQAQAPMRTEAQAETAERDDSIGLTAGQSKSVAGDPSAEHASQSSDKAEATETASQFSPTDQQQFAVARSSAHYKVSKLGQTLKAESGQQQPSANGIESAAPAQQPAVTAALPGSAEKPLATTGIAQDTANPIPPASAEPAPLDNSSPLPIPQTNISETDTTIVPQTEVDAKAAPDFFVESVTVEPPAAGGKTANAKQIGDQAAAENDEAETASDESTLPETSEVKSKANLPKPAGMPATPQSDTAQAASSASYTNADSEEADAGTTSTFANSDDTAGAVELAKAPEKPETLKPESHVTRHVTETVTPDGAVRVTQTTETRSAAAGTQPDVVVDRVTVQALPEQALRSVRYMMQSGDHTMRLRLVPESLGEVRLEVTSSKDGVAVKMASASPAVRELLQSHSAGLRDALQQDNTQTVRVTVTQDMASTNWQSGNNNRHDNAQQGGAQRQSTSSDYAPAKQQSTITAPRREARHSGQLNLYV